MCIRDRGGVGISLRHAIPPCSTVESWVHTFSDLVAELPCQITTPLADMETQEGETVSLVVVISKRRPVKWSKNGQELAASDRVQVSVSEDGLRHVLTLKDVSKDEVAEFTASVDDGGHGTITTSCKLTVTGRLHHPSL